MKNDPAFKFLAVIILAGVALALFAPDTRSTESEARATGTLGRTSTPLVNASKADSPASTRTEMLRLTLLPRT